MLEWICPAVMHRDVGTWRWRMSRWRWRYVLAPVFTMKSVDVAPFSAKLCACNYCSLHEAEASEMSEWTKWISYGLFHGREKEAATPPSWRRSVAWFCRSLLQTGLTCWCSSLLRRPVFSFNGTEAYRIQLLFNSLLIEKVRWVQYRRIIMRSQAWIHYFKLHRESWCLSIFV